MGSWRSLGIDCDEKRWRERGRSAPSIGKQGRLPYWLRDKSLHPG
jgi:hypothetical protein